MAKIAQFTGKYQRKGSTLEGKTTLLICERARKTKKKARFFIVQKDQQGKKRYISSIYPAGVNLYRFDYFGRFYLMRLEATQATIEEAPKNRKSDSIVSLSDLVTNCIIQEGGKG